MFQNGKFEIMYTNKNRRYVTHITRRNVQTNLRILIPIQQGKKRSYATLHGEYIELFVSFITIVKEVYLHF
jgi:hypothetical protein